MRQIDDEVSILKRRLQVVESRLDNTRARDALPSIANNARLARVTNPSPEGDAYNLYAIKFLDGDFPDTTGSISVDYTDRQQSNTAAYVCNVTGARIPQNTVILAYWWSNRWWTSYSTGAENEMALVRVAGSGGIPSCNNVGPSAPSIYPGKLVTVDTNQAFNTNNAYIDGADVWLLEVTHCTVVSSLKQQERFIGRKIGQYTLGGETRDLYEIKTSSESTPTSDIQLVSIYANSGTADMQPVYTVGSYWVFDGRLVAVNIGQGDMHDEDGSNPYSQTTPIWICDASHRIKNYYFNKNERFLGKRMGTFTVSGDERDLYIISEVREDPIVMAGIQEGAPNSLPEVSAGVRAIDQLSFVGCIRRASKRGTVGLVNYADGFARVHLSLILNFLYSNPYTSMALVMRGGPIGGPFTEFVFSVRIHVRPVSGSFLDSTWASFSVSDEAIVSLSTNREYRLFLESNTFLTSSESFKASFTIERVNSQDRENNMYPTSLIP